MPYTALKLDDASKATLEAIARVFGMPASWETRCEHMTIEMKPLAKSQVADRAGCEYLIVVKAIGRMAVGEGGIMAAAVETDCPSKNVRKHITLGFLSPAKPVMSNDITSWVALSEPVTLMGRVEEMPDGPRASTPPKAAA